MIRRLFRIISPSVRRGIIGATMTTALADLLEGLVFLAAWSTLTAVMGDDHVSWWKSALVLLAALALNIAVENMARTWRTRSTLRAARETMRRIALHADELPLGWFTPTHQALLDKIVGGAFRTIQIMLDWTYPRVLSAYVRAVVAVLLLAVFFDIRIAAAVAIATAAALLIIRMSAPLVRRLAREAERESEEASVQIVEYAQAQPLLRAFAGTAHAASTVLRSYEKLTQRQRKEDLADTAGALLGPSLTFILGTVATVWICILGDLDTASAIVAVLISMWVSAAFGGFAHPLNGISLSAEMMDDVLAILDAAPLPEPSAPLPMPNSSNGLSLRFEQVSFAYRADEPVLTEISFTVPAGTNTALVGTSGAGKSTILRLAARFWDANDGSVCIGGTDVRDVSSRQLMEAFSIVFQDVYLFEGTLRENLLIARPDATDAQLDAAAARANLYEIIGTLPDGWDTLVGERGTTLSGGQRQRVSIARALLKDTPIVLLDEPTAALDAENAHLLSDALRELGEGRTVLTVTHRLETARDTDQIIVIEKGRVAQIGTHTRLLSEPGAYSHLWEAHIARA